MMRITLTICIIFLLCSCVVRENKSVPSENTSDLVISRLDRWLDYYDLKISNFTDSLPMAELDLISSDHEFLSEVDHLYGSFFIFSPDSSNYIDLDSYSLVLEKDSLGQLISTGSEIDTEAAWIDLKRKKRSRILFCGTECRPEEAYWVKNNVVYILGISKLDDMDFAAIWKFDIDNHFFQQITTSDPIDLTGKNYSTEVRLKTIGFTP